MRNEGHQPFDRLVHLAVAPVASVADAFSMTQDPKRLIQTFMESWREDIDPSPLLYFQYLPRHGGLFLAEMSGWNGNHVKSRFVDLSEEKEGLEQLLRHEAPLALVKYLHNDLHTAEFQMFPLLISNDGPGNLAGVFVSGGTQSIGSGHGRVYWHLLSLHFQKACLQLKLRKQETRDPLTDLLDRRAFLKNLDDEVARARRILQPLSLMLIDIDGMENGSSSRSQLGTMMSRMECWVSYVLQKTSRPSDCLARLGVGHFAALLPHTSSQGAVEKAERLQIQLRHTQRFPTTVTIAISEYPSLTEDAEGLVRTASDTIRGLRTKMRSGGFVGVVKRPGWLQPDFPVPNRESMKVSL